MIRSASLPKGRHPVTMTTGAILRRIAKTPLSVSAHKLATVILNGIAWKEGYNGLERGTAAFTLAHIAEKIGVSRQHLSEFPAELAASSLALLRELLTKQVGGRHKRGGSRFGKTAEVIIGVCTAGAMTEEQHQWASAPQPERLPPLRPRKSLPTLHTIWQEACVRRMSKCRGAADDAQHSASPRRRAQSANWLCPTEGRPTKETQPPVLDLLRLSPMV